MSKIEQLEKRIKDLERKVCCKTQFFDTVNDLPTEGSTGVIYVTEDGNIYVWNGVDYTLNGLGDVYYTNSYVERLKALGSDVQYSNYLGLTTNAVILTDNVVSIHSIYIPKTSIITGVGWFQNTGGINTLDNYNGIGLYSFDGVNSIELLTSTSNQNLFQTTSGYKTEDFDDVLTINKGIYYIGFLFNKSAGFVDPNLITNSTTAIPDVLMQSVNGLNLNILVSGSNTLPTTVDISTATKTTITQIFTLY